MDIKLGKVVTYQWEATIFKAIWSFDHVAQWVQVTIWKIYIFTIKRFMTSKPGSVLTYRRRFRMQTLKSSLTSCYELKQEYIETFLFNH